MKIEELEKLFEKSYGYKKTSIWNINGLTVDANNIDEEVTKKLDIELRGRSIFNNKKEIFKNPVIMTKQGENYFIKVELEHKIGMCYNKEGKKEPYYEDGKPTYDLECSIEGYWKYNEYNNIELKDTYLYPKYYGVDKKLIWENYGFKDIVKLVNKIIDMYFMQEVLTKLLDVMHVHIRELE